MGMVGSGAGVGEWECSGTWRAQPNRPCGPRHVKGACRKLRRVALRCRRSTEENEMSDDQESKRPDRHSWSVDGAAARWEDTHPDEAAEYPARSEEHTPELQS